MQRLLVFTLSIFLLLCSGAHSVPVFYSLNGTATAYGGNNPPLVDDISGTMVIESEPSLFQYDQQSQGGVLHWSVDSVVITSSAFNFYGSGSLNLGGDSTGIYNFNESVFSGYGYTPYQQGPMYHEGSPNIAYKDDGTPVEMTFSAYSKELPYMISPHSGGSWPTPGGGWRFLFADNSGGATISNFYAVRSTVSAPVPEPSTMLLVGCGLVGFAAGWRRKKHGDK